MTIDNETKLPAADDISTAMTPREIELATLAETDPGTYHWSDNGSLAKEHLELKQAREGDGEAEGDDADDEDLEHGDGADEVEKEPTADEPTDADQTDSESEEQEEDLESPTADLSVPEAADDYIASVVDKHAWAESDPIVAEFAEYAHEQGVPHVGFAAALGFIEQLRARQQAADSQQNNATKTRLREQWGDSYKPNVQAMREALADERQFPAGIGHALTKARLPDGSLIVNHPGFASMLLSIARQRDGGSTPASDEARLAELNEIMHNDVRDLYNRKNAKGQTLSEEQLELRRKVDARKRRPAA